MNKKLGRMKQWAGERMGQESKTGVSEEFKEMESEMDMRHKGMDDLHRSMTTYVKALSKRNEEGKNKQLVTNHLGSTMSRHGEDFEADSEFGKCLIALGRSNERLGRFQEGYVTDATNVWLESTERSLCMMKEYQSARKKLEQRRLAYDASLSKMQRAKRDDFRVEEELRAQKAKYEESNEDVFRRMEDIKEAEEGSIDDLGALLDAQLAYFEKCTAELQRLKAKWPAAEKEERYERPTSRSRAGTAHTYHERQSKNARKVEVSDDSDSEDLRSRSKSRSRKPENIRASTFQGPTSLRETPSDWVRQASMPPAIERARSGLRPTRHNSKDTFGDPSDDESLSADQASFRDRSVSPATSYGSMKALSQTSSVSAAKKGPPPQPNRATKPAPPAKKPALTERYGSTDENPWK